MNTSKNSLKSWLRAIGLGAVSMAIAASCDPQTGAFSFLRVHGGDDDDCCGYYDPWYYGGYYEDVYYDDYGYGGYYYEDCYWGDCY